MNLYQMSKFLILVALIGYGEAAPARAESRGPRPYLGSRLDPYRITLPINRTRLTESFREHVTLTNGENSFSFKPQELTKRLGVDDEVDENKPKTHSRTLQNSSGSLQGRSKPGAFPWEGLNPKGTYPWTRTIICMAICERNTYHMREILKGKGRWQACILKCKSDGSMTDITGEVYEASFKEDFAPLNYYKGYLDYISDQTGVVEPKNWFLDWRPAY